MDSFIGCVISLHCGDVLGTYQGLVSSFDQVGQTITITKAFRNGIQCNVSSVTISARDITDLKILKTKEEAASMPEIRLAYSTTPTNTKASSNSPVKNTFQSPQKHTSSKTTKANNERVGRNSKTPTEPLSSSRQKSNENDAGSVSSSKTRGTTSGIKEQRTRSASPGKQVSHSRRAASHQDVNSPSEMNQRTNNHHQNDRSSRSDLPSIQQQDSWPLNNAHQSPRGNVRNSPQKLENRPIRGRSVSMQQRNKECFSEPVDTFLDTEFDFEKNLALFDKCAVFEEIENQTGVKVVKPTGRQTEAKYRCDENVLPSKPHVMKQISFDVGSDHAEYVTDSGLFVPSITYDVRHKLLRTAEQMGLGMERQIEAVGRSTAEMVMQLLGGCQRLAPQNAHQQPTVVVLCGPNLQGAHAANCARHLAMHNVRITVFITSSAAVVTEPLKSELELLHLANPSQAANISDLPTGGVDMIIAGVEHPGNDTKVVDKSLIDRLAEWVRTCRAPTLAIDPPTLQTPLFPPKYSIAVGLPLSGGHLRNSQLYLCDLGIPTLVYKKAGIKYTSPFGHKFLIPLHLKSS